MSAPLDTLHLDLTSRPQGLCLRRGLAVAATAGVLTAVVGPPPVIAATTDTSTATVHVGVGSVIFLVTRATDFYLDTRPGSTQALDAVEYAVGTNSSAGYTVTVQAEAAALTPADPANTDSIPIDDLGVRASGSASGYTPVSDTAPVTLASSPTRTGSTGDVYLNDYRVDVPLVADDTYSVALDYVATAS